MKKICPMCNTPFEDNSPNGAKDTCSTPCRRAYYIQEHPQKYFESLMTMRFCVLKQKGVAVTKEDKVRITEKVLLGVCDMCGGTFGWRDLHIDHNHTSNRLRGVLCVRCNYLLGFARDDVQMLLAAVKYLEERSSTN